MLQKHWDASVIQDVSEWLIDKLDWFYDEKDMLSFVWFYIDGIPSRMGYIKYVQLWPKGQSQVPFYANAIILWR